MAGSDEQDGDFSKERIQLATVALATVATALPVYLVGTLAVGIRESLHFNATILGLVISSYYVGAAVMSVPLSRLPDRVGATQVIRVAMLICAGCLLLLAVATVSWVVLGALLFVSGGVSSATVAATNQFLVRNLPLRHQGLAFGVKQAAIPTASLLGGLAVPIVAITIGWRWAFGIATLSAIIASVLVSRIHSRKAKPRRAISRGPNPRLDRTPLIVLAIGLGLGLFAATGLNAFLVTAGVGVGLSQSWAGLLVATTGVVAVAMRIFIGLTADRWLRDYLKAVGIILGLGSFGYLALAISSYRQTAWLFVCGSILALGIGWGWNGLFNFAIAQAYKEAPARATGITQVGGRVGGLLGPATIGLLADHTSFVAAWLLAALAVVGAVLAVTIGRRMLDSRARPANTIGDESE